MKTNDFEEDIKVIDILATIETIKLELKNLELLVRKLDDYEKDKK